MHSLVESWRICFYPTRRSILVDVVFYTIAKWFWCFGRWNSLAQRSLKLHHLRGWSRKHTFWESGCDSKMAQLHQSHMVDQTIPFSVSLRSWGNCDGTGEFEMIWNECSISRCWCLAKILVASYRKCFNAAVVHVLDCTLLAFWSQLFTACSTVYRWHKYIKGVIRHWCCFTGFVLGWGHHTAMTIWNACVWILANLFLHIPQEHFSCSCCVQGEIPWHRAFVFTVCNKTQCIYIQLLASLAAI